MKKIALFIIVFIACCTIAEAQTSGPQKLLGIDTSKLSPNNLAPFANLSPLKPLTPQVPQSEILQKLIDLTNPLGTLDKMPVAKLNSADRMPILKLADTETTHYTMLIKPLAPIRQIKPVTP